MFTTESQNILDNKEPLTGDSFNSIEISKVKGRDLTTGEPLSLDTYLEKRKRKIKKGAEAAHFFEKFKSSPQYKMEKFYRDLINKKVDIGKTSDGRKVIGQILTVKNTRSKKINETRHNGLKAAKNLENLKSNDVEENSNDNKMSTTFDKHNFMAKSLEKFTTTIKSSSPALLNRNGGKDSITKLLNNESDFEINIINDILEDHKYTDNKIASFKEIKEESDVTPDNLDHKNTDFRIGEKEECIINNYEDPEDLILSSYNSLLSINVVTQHNYSRLSKKSKNKTSRFSAGDRNSTETVNLHEYPKKIGYEKHPHENKKMKTDKFNCKTSCSYPYSCDVCHRRFLKSATLQKHIQTQICNERKLTGYKYCFTCAVCRRKFSRMATLDKHMQTCNGHKATYSCSFCGCSYHYISSLTRHMVQNHVEKETGNFKIDSDCENELYFEVPATEIITEDSILLEEDASFTDNESNMMVKSQRLGGNN